MGHDSIELNFDDVTDAEKRRRIKTEFEGQCHHVPFCPMYKSSSKRVWVYVCQLGDFHLLAALKKASVERNFDDGRILLAEVRKRQLSLDMLPER